ncbi:MFS transporter [Novipirellula sp. SH528]|uniref:MFS transporter n=1 Tax=Novipirellula sp. SH528 TaxID=3454466 RepID=UPI003F9F7639
MNDVRLTNTAHQSVRALFCVNGFLFATWATRIPAVQTQFSLSDGQLGMLLMVIATGAVIAMPISGWCCSRFGSKEVAIASVVAYLVGLPAIALVPSVPWLMFALFFFGSAHGALDVAMNVQAVEVERRRQQPIMSAIHALWSLGGLTGAVVGGLLAANGLGVRVHFVVLAALIGLAVYPISIHLLKVHQTDSSSDSDRSSLTDSADSRRDRPTKTILTLGVMAFCVMAGEGAMADWSAVLLTRTLGASEGIAAMGYAAFAIAMAGGRFVGDAMTKRLGARNQVRISGSLAAAGILLVVLASHITVTIVGFACVGAGLSTIVPIVFSACGQLRGVASGAALATVSTIGYFGFLLGPPLIGFVAEYASLRIALSALLFTTLMPVALATVLKEKSPAFVKRPQLATG